MTRKLKMHNWFNGFKKIMNSTHLSVYDSCNGYGSNFGSFVRDFVLKANSML